MRGSAEGAQKRGERAARGAFSLVVPLCAVYFLVMGSVSLINHCKALPDNKGATFSLVKR